MVVSGAWSGQPSDLMDAAQTTEYRSTKRFGLEVSHVHQELSQLEFQQSAEFLGTRLCLQLSPGNDQKSQILPIELIA